MVMSESRANEQGFGVEFSSCVQAGAAVHAATEAAACKGMGGASFGQVGMGVDAAGRLTQRAWARFFS